MVVVRNDPTLNKYEFFKYGTQYYLSGRASFLNQLFPVGVNLLHHAVEMLLKSGLVMFSEPEKLFELYKHDLNKMWPVFKEKFINKDLEKFDNFIVELNKWEELRYPKRTELGIAMMFAIERSTSKLKFEKQSNSLSYEITLEDADEFFALIFKILSIDKSFLNFSYKSSIFVAWNIYEERNKHIIL